MKDLNNMSLKELEEYKTKLYNDNTQNGNIHKLYTIARILGVSVPHNYGPKYLYKEDEIEIYVDDYGHYMTTKVNGKLKASTHNDKLYAPGEWEEIINRLYPEAQAQQKEMNTANEQYEKQRLLNLLS
jgi:hypothetical protein